MRNHNIIQSAFDTEDLPHQRFDVGAKEVIRIFPEDFLQFLIPAADIEFLSGFVSALKRRNRYRLMFRFGITCF